MAPILRRRRPRSPAPHACFLCGRDIEGEGLVDAWSRTLTDVVPSRVEFAHRECAFEGGFLDAPGDEEEGDEEIPS